MNSSVLGIHRLWSCAAFAFLLCLAFPQLGLAQSRCSDAGSPVKIVFVGDSITHGPVESGSFRRPLYQRLLNEGFAIDFVGSWNTNYTGPWPNTVWLAPIHTDFDSDHEGHFGWRADEIAASLPGWLSAYTPDVAVIHLGTNDVFQNQSTESTLDDLRSIAASLRADCSHIAIVLTQLIATSETWEMRDQRIVQLNAALPALRNELNQANSPVWLVDQFSGFDPSTMTGDGIHPTPAGESQMADRYRDALRPWLLALREAETPVDSGMDGGIAADASVSVDAGVDGGNAHDASNDAAADASVDSGMDAGVDSGVDAEINDAGTRDANHADANTQDTSTQDTSTLDAGTSFDARMDSMVSDSMVFDASPFDASSGPAAPSKGCRMGYSKSSAPSMLSLVLFAFLLRQLRPAYRQRFRASDQGKRLKAKKQI